MDLHEQTNASSHAEKHRSYLDKRVQDLISWLGKDYAETSDELLQALETTSIALGGPFISCFVSIPAHHHHFRCQVATTLPKRWLIEYKLRGYKNVDPIIKATEEAGEPFLFSDLEVPNKTSRKFWLRAEAAGVGNTGFCIPVLYPSGLKIGVGYCYDRNADTIESLFYENAAQLNRISSYLSDMFISVSIVGSGARPPLTDDETKYLRYLATSDAPERIKDLKFRYSGYRNIQKSIVRKLGAPSIFQCLAIAIRYGYLDSGEWDDFDVSASQREPNGYSWIAGEQEE